MMFAPLPMPMPVEVAAQFMICREPTEEERFLAAFQRNLDVIAAEMFRD